MDAELAVLYVYLHSKQIILTRGLVGQEWTRQRDTTGHWHGVRALARTGRKVRKSCLTDDCGEQYGGGMFTSTRESAVPKLHHGSFSILQPNFDNVIRRGSRDGLGIPLYLI